MYKTLIIDKQTTAVKQTNKQTKQNKTKQNKTKQKNYCADL